MPEKKEARDYAKIYLEIVNKYKMNLTQCLGKDTEDNVGKV